jgi:hypothetical protein
MFTKHLVAAALAAFGTSAVLAQEATPDTWMKETPPVKSRAEVAREVAAARASGDLDILREYDIVDRHYMPTLTRAEVLADLQIWQRAGLDRFGRGEASPDVHSPEYRRAFARYAALRASPEFAALVKSIAVKRGEAPPVQSQAQAGSK